MRPSFVYWPVATKALQCSPTLVVTRRAFALFHFVVVIGKFHPLVHGDEVYGVEFGAFGFEAVCDALEFLLVFGGDVGPGHRLREGAKVGPVVLDVVGDAEFDGFFGVFDFGAEEIAVLEAARGGVAFE